jgi:putative membrane protein
LASAVYNEVAEQIRVVTDAMGHCQKIRTTPMVYGYVATLRSLLVVWLASMPFSLVGMFGWWAVPALGILSFLYLSIEQVRCCPSNSGP